MERYNNACVEYPVVIWRLALMYNAIIDFPFPTGGHGWTLKSGKAEPLWVDGPIPRSC